MDDFATRPGKPNIYGLIQGEVNAVAPGKRMLSSMCPSIAVARRAATRLVWGTPGGSTIPTTNFQVLLGCPPARRVARRRGRRAALPPAGLPRQDPDRARPLRPGLDRGPREDRTHGREREPETTRSAITRSRGADGTVHADRASPPSGTRDRRRRIRAGDGAALVVGRSRVDPDGLPPALPRRRVAPPARPAAAARRARSG